MPFYIRAGKSLPVTSTEAVARFRKRCRTVIEDSALSRNHLRFRISPEMTIAMGATVMGPGDALKGGGVRRNDRQPPAQPDEMDAYERVLGDAMVGDATLFAREDYVEEAWRIVDPVLKVGTPIHLYEEGNVGAGSGRSPDFASWRLA